MQISSAASNRSLNALKSRVDVDPAAQRQHELVVTTLHGTEVRNLCVLVVGGTEGELQSSIGLPADVFRAARYTTVPKSAPTPAVIAMASAPQNVTRIAPARTPAPPTCAASPPRSARKNREDPETR